MLIFVVAVVAFCLFLFFIFALLWEILTHSSSLENEVC